MNWLDITLLCLAGIGIVKGLFDGIIKQVVSLIALLSGVFFCSKVALWLKGYLLALDWFPAKSVSLLSFIIGLRLTVGLVRLAGALVSRLVHATPLSLLNHLGGDRKRGW